MTLLLSGIWFIGAAAVLGHEGIRHKRFLKMIRRWSSEVKEPDILRNYQAVCTKRGIKAGIPLKICQCVHTPMLVGLWRPRILLPDQNYGLEEISLILEHELVHYQRKDLWYKGLLLFAGTIQWFNPVFYMMRREINNLCEISCDEEVLKGAAEEIRFQYTETIIGIVRSRAGMQTVLSTSFYGGKNSMKKRITSIMDSRKKKAGAAIVVAALIVTMCSQMVFAAKPEKIPWSAFANQGGQTNNEATAAETCDPEDLLGKDYEKMTLSEYEAAMAKALESTQSMAIATEIDQSSDSAGIVLEEATAVAEDRSVMKKESEESQASASAVEAGGEQTTDVITEEAFLASPSASESVGEQNTEVITEEISSDQIIYTGGSSSNSYMVQIQLPFQAKDADGKSHSMRANIWYEYQVPAKETITVKELNQIIESYEKGFIQSLESRKFEDLKLEENYRKIEDEMMEYIKKQTDEKVSFKKVQLNMILEHTQKGNETLYSLQDEVENTADLEQYAKSINFNYLKVDFLEKDANDDKMTEVFAKNKLSADDQVLVEFSDGAYVLYDPQQSLYFTSYCSSGTLGAKIVLDSKVLQEFSQQEIESKVKDAEKVIFDILDAGKGTAADIKKEITKEVAKKIGIPEKYLQVTVD